MSEKRCKVPECKEKHCARGYCNKHYSQAKKRGETWPAVKYTAKCTVPQCGQPHIADGLCGMHYQRQRKHGDVNTVKSKSDAYPDKCTIPECDRPFLAKGICGPHYHRKNLNPDIPIGATQEPYNKLPRDVAARNHWYTRYRVDARVRKLAWELTGEQFDTLIFAPCNYCGLPPDHLVTRKDRPIGPLYVSGIDRIDNSGGYSWCNVVACCRICNRAKNVMTISEWYTWINRLVSHQRPDLGPKET